MAFNGSGTYSLPAGNPVTTGTTISSTWANNTLSDIATALTDCVTRDGQSTPTANIPMGSYKLIGLGQASATGDALGWGQNASVVNLTVSGTSAHTGAASFGGTVALSADPTTSLQAATKQYVDSLAVTLPATATTLEMQTGTQTATRTVSPALVSSAITALAPKTYIKSAQGILAGQVVTSSTSPVSTGLSATITPASTANKIMVVINANIAASGSGYPSEFRVYRGGVQISVTYTTTYGTFVPFNYVILDSPATTSAITYALYFDSVTAGNTPINSTALNVSSINLFEVTA